MYRRGVFRVILDDSNLLMGYGAADQKIGISTVPFNYLLKTIKTHG
jgi:predicted GH43/DUF377 family glycosyl hydrolase